MTYEKENSTLLDDAAAVVLSVVRNKSPGIRLQL